MSSFDAATEGNNSNQQDSDEKDTGVQGTAQPNGSTKDKPAHQDADTLPDGSGNDSHSSGGNQDQENDEQPFDAG